MTDAEAEVLRTLYERGSDAIRGRYGFAHFNTLCRLQDMWLVARRDDGAWILTPRGEAAIRARLAS